MLKIESPSQEDFQPSTHSGARPSSRGSAGRCLDADSSTWDPNSSSLKITRISAAMRDPNRVNIYINHKFSFSLDVAQVIDYNVKLNQELTAERFELLKSASEFGKLYQRTLEWCLTRPHSIKETRDYLRRRQLKRQTTNRERTREEKKPFPEIREETSNLVIERLIEKGYLDDERFANYFVENRRLRQGISRKKLEYELRSKGISENIIAESLRNSSRDNSAEIEKLIAKKIMRYDEQKLIAYLVRQGFSYDESKKAITEYRNKHDSQALDI